MRKIKHYQGNAFDFHLKVLSHKHNSVQKKIVQSLEQEIKKQFEQYDTKYSNNSLHELTAMSVKAEHKEALQNMYSYKMKPFQNLKKELTTDSNNRVSNLCPNCTIETIGSFDHCIPQSEFSEFSDNPLNLMPCCTTCNSKKNAIWREQGKRVFLNLYLDDIPNIQYLFVNIQIIENVPIVSYSVDNRNQIEDELYNKIYNHYNKLNLCYRFSENSHDTISELEREIKHYTAKLSEDIVKNVIIKKANEERNIYGFNYWKALLKIECCTNTIVFDYLKNI